MYKYLPVIFLLLMVQSCKTPSGIFVKKTEHDQYGDKIDQAGLRQTELGNAWFTAAEKAIANALPVQLPYKENGYFAAERIDAAGFRFQATRGEQITIRLSKIPVNNYRLFGDLFIVAAGAPKLIKSIDSVNSQLQYTAKETSTFIVRLQPELLKSGSYMIEISTGPSLGFPVPSPGAKNKVISFWGAGRDNGSRSHEGIDIGGNRGTPLIAIGDGYVSRVTNNNLGGKVVFIHSETGDESWYYAHLDSQLVYNGQKVKAGDTIGLMGNTGNAITTAPHLHFGIYTRSGAVDPFPYINPEKKSAKPVTAPTILLGRRMRITGKTPLYFTPDLNQKEDGTENLPVLLTAATQQFYKAVLPGGETRFVASANIEPLEKSIKQITVKQDVRLTDSPLMDSPVIDTLTAGTRIDLLGQYKEYQYVKAENHYGWISR